MLITEAKVVVRRLPSAYAMIHNMSINESIIPPVRIAGNVGEDLYIKVNSVLKRVNSIDIYLVEGLRDYVNIYTKKKHYTIRSTICGMLDKLPKDDFMRVHRSYIIRLDSIASIAGDRLIVDARRIPVSKTYKSELMKRLDLIGN